MTERLHSIPEFCGQRGERGVCVRPHAHFGRCETNRAEPIHFSKEEKEERRFLDIAGDWIFALTYAVDRGKL